jgi:hypothetical protein
VQNGSKSHKIVEFKFDLISVSTFKVIQVLVFDFLYVLVKMEY